MHFVTYESLLLEPEQALTDLGKFLLNKESLEGTVMAKRIRQACSELEQNNTDGQVYKPRSGKINKNMHHFNES